MDLTNFSSVTHWVIANGYVLMFIAMFIEGPIVTAAAAFAAALGYFNIYIVFLLSILGDLAADTAYYFMGYYGRYKLVDRLGHRFGLSEERIKKLESVVKKNTIKAMLFIKLTPIFATPGLIAAGAVRLPFKRFIFWCFILIVPKSFLFLITGYYFGTMFNVVNKYFEIGSLVIVFSIIVMAILYYVFQKAEVKIAKKIEKNKINL
jgi:membrane protein DedA with SNARE-associated domain